MSLLLLVAAGHVSVSFMRHGGVESERLFAGIKRERWNKEWKKNGKFFGEQFLPVYSQAKGVYALKDSSQDLYLRGRDGVKLYARRKVGSKGRSSLPSLAPEQAGRAGILWGVRRQCPAPGGAQRDGGLGRDVFPPAGFLEVSLCLQSF